MNAFVKFLSRQSFCTVPKPSNGSTASSHRIKTTNLPNKMVISTLDTTSPIARVSIVFRAGSRNEIGDTIGTSHLLRIVSGNKTEKFSRFGITRYTQSVGGSLSATVDRETVCYSLLATKDSIRCILPILAEVATKPLFRPWEVKDCFPRLKYELAMIPDQARAVDLMHKAAFKMGLGNSLFCPEFMVGTHTSDTLSNFVRQLFTTNRCAVIGAGVDFNELLEFATNLELESGDGPEDTANYFGGEQRIEKLSEVCHVAVGMPTPGLSDIDQAIVHCILQYALGEVPHIKWSPGNSLLSTAITQAGIEEFCAISALNVSYSDVGLFGFVFSCPEEHAGTVLEAGLSTVKRGEIDSSSIARGKTQLKASLFYDCESDERVLTDMGNQAVLTGKIISADDLAAMVDSVSDEDVNSAMKELSQSNIAVGAVGALDSLPYLEEYS